MKKINLAFILLLLVSCTDISNLETDFIEQKNSDKENFVTIHDIETLQKVQMPQTRSSLEKKYNITCYKDEANDTLFYIVDHQDRGWTIYASDKRVPAIIAQSNKGIFKEALENENLSAWISIMAKDMKQIKKSKDKELNFTFEEISNNIKFWKSISTPDEFMKEEISNKTRKLHESATGGHYELTSSNTYIEELASTPTIIETLWHQNHPYNSYCPYKTDFSGDKAPAGCVAIAAAQVLYHLHYKLGTPEKAPSWAYCNGNIDSYQMEQNNFSAEIWDRMSYNMTDSAASPLIAHIGKLLNMKYGNVNSIADPSLLKYNVFSRYGISCKYTNEYDTSILCQNLKNGIPVIINAQNNNTSTRNGTNSITDKEECGHSFIANRFKQERQVTVNVYEWVVDIKTKNPYVPDTPFKTEYKYTYQNTMIGFNWGYGPIYSDQIDWFTLTGDWIRTGSNKNWTRDIEMIYDFKKQ